MRVPTISRREMLAACGGGFGGLALSALLAEEPLRIAESSVSAAHPAFHHPPKARRVLQLFMNGGASQMDTFDYKPELIKRHGEKVDFGIKSAATSEPGAVM